MFSPLEFPLQISGSKCLDILGLNDKIFDAVFDFEIWVSKYSE